MELLIRVLLLAVVVVVLAVGASMAFHGTSDVRCWWEATPHCPSAFGGGNISTGKSDSVKQAESDLNSAYTEATAVAIHAQADKVRSTFQTPEPSNGQPASNTGGSASNGGSSGSQVYTFEWVSGDLNGETNTCHIMISEPNGNVELPPSHGMTSGIHSFNAASKAVYDDNVQNIQKSANSTGPCDIVSQPSSLPFN